MTTIIHVSSGKKKCLLWRLQRLEGSLSYLRTLDSNENFPCSCGNLAGTAVSGELMTRHPSITHSWLEQSIVDGAQEFEHNRRLVLPSKWLKSIHVWRRTLDSILPPVALSVARPCSRLHFPPIVHFTFNLSFNILTSEVGINDSIIVLLCKVVQDGEL